MSQQSSFTDLEYANRRHRTKREDFLNAMDEIVPWDKWVSIIKEVYPEGKRGRKPIGIETMLRMYLMQNWFNLSDAGIEDAIYDSYAMKKFLGIDFAHEQVPDATTLLKFRHLLEAKDITKKLFADVTERLRPDDAWRHHRRCYDYQGAEFY